MKLKFRLIFTILLILEFGILASFGYKFLQNRLKILGTSTVVELNKNAFSQNPDPAIAGFYEPKIGAEEGIQKAMPDWLDKKPNYHINADGLNDRFDYSVSIPLNTYRIITLGDSFTFGQYVDVDSNYPEKLEDLLNNSLKCQGINKFEVINLGVPGYDLELDLERFRLRGQKYNPDLVLILVKDDDFQDLREFTSIRAKTLQEEAEKDKPNDFGQIWDTAFRQVQQTYSEQEITEYHKSALKNFKDSYPNKLILFTLAQTNPKWQKLITNFANSQKETFYFDSLSDVNALGQILPDTHPSPQGYQTISADLLKFILGNNLISCDK